MIQSVAPFPSGTETACGDEAGVSIREGVEADFAEGDLTDFAEGDLTDFAEGDLTDFAEGDLDSK